MSYYTTIGWGWKVNKAIGIACTSACGKPIPKDAHVWAPPSFTESAWEGPTGSIGHVWCYECAMKSGQITSLPPVFLPVEDSQDQSGAASMSDWKGWEWKYPAAGQLGAAWKCINNYQDCKKVLVGSEPAFFQLSNSFNGLSGNVFCEPCVVKYGHGIPMPDPSTLGSPNVPATDVKKVAKKKQFTKCLGCKEHICNVCNVCHTDDCDFSEYRVTTPELMSKFSFLRAKTQKAKGYIVLGKANLTIPRPFSVMLDSATEDEIKAITAQHRGGTRFVRPCPTRPRHGFVDSRPIDFNTEDVEQKLKDLLTQAKQFDEQGKAELLIVPYIESTHNAIVTPSRVAVGPGNDGATAGHKSIIIPLMGVPFMEITPDVLQRSGVNVDEEDPYIEAVQDTICNVYFTQLRAGAKIPASVGADYIPRRMRVADIIEASGDLLEWEAQTKRIQPGTVVCHLGGSLISHYGVHCMQNNIPIFTSHKPEIGEMLEEVTRPPKPSPQAVIRGLAAGTVLPISTYRESASSMDVRRALLAMMVTLHNSAAFSGDDGFWIGVAVSIMYRAGMSASHGEARHKSCAGVSRSSVYKMSFKDFFAARETLGKAQYKFLNSVWSSGYGGPAWAKCTDAIIQMDNAARELMNNPCDERVSALVTKLNNAVNQAHNGGWWLNKFIEQEEFTAASKQSLSTVTQAAIAMFTIKELTESVEWESVLEKWRLLPDISVENGQILVEKEMNIVPSFDTSEDIEDDVDDIGENQTNKLSIVPDHEYVGSMCDTCGELYGGMFSKHHKPSVVCGSTYSDTKVKCPGHVGWYEAGKFTLFGSDLVGPEQATGGVVLSELPAKYKKPMGPNLNDSFDADSVNDTNYVLKAQANIKTKSSGTALHIQYALNGLHGYLSTDVFLPGYYPNMGVYSDIAKHYSWSGSGVDDYIEMTAWLTPEPYMGNLTILALNINVTLDIRTKKVTVNSVNVTLQEEELNGQTPQSKEKESTFSFDIETPF